MDDKKRKISLEDQLPADIGGGTGLDNGCGLQEGQFPSLGNCFEENRSIAGLIFKPACPYCSIWTSMPEGTDLVVAHLFECMLYGYVKRVRE